MYVVRPSPRPPTCVLTPSAAPPQSFRDPHFSPHAEPPQHDLPPHPPYRSQHHNGHAAALHRPARHRRRVRPVTAPPRLRGRRGRVASPPRGHRDDGGSDGGHVRCVRVLLVLRCGGAWLIVRGGAVDAPVFVLVAGIEMVPIESKPHLTRVHDQHPL